MHPCLRVPELASLIAEECAPNIHTSTHESLDLRAVYALARTCRALHGPALDVLWYSQRTLKHLLMCMPDDLWCSVPTPIKPEGHDGDYEQLVNILCESFVGMVIR